MNPVPESLRQQVKSYDGLLDVKAYPAIRRYALVAIWPENDERRVLLQKGEIDDDCDILGWLTVDIQDANTDAIPLDQVERQIERILSRADNQKTPWKLRLAQIVEKNIKRRKEIKAPVIEKVEQIARDLKYMVGLNKASKMEKIMKEVPFEYQED